LKGTTVKKYTQRQWDRTVGYGSVPKEYSIEVERLEHENKVLRKMIYSLSSNTKKQVDEFIAIALTVEKKDGP
jgi:GH24 family phage-related lysozyme (muramidase)